MSLIMDWVVSSVQLVSPGETKHLQRLMTVMENSHGWPILGIIECQALNVRHFRSFVPVLVNCAWQHLADPLDDRRRNSLSGEGKDSAKDLCSVYS